MLSTLKRLFARKPVHLRKRPTFRPRLEALEDRWCLATTYYWDGDTSNNWATQTNWHDALNNPGVPGVGDTAIFDGDVAIVNNAPDLSADVTIAKIQAVDGWNGTLNLISHSLTVNGTDTSSWTCGTLNVTTGEEFIRQNGWMDVQGGSITGSGTFIIKNGATVSFSTNFSTFQPKLHIGAEDGTSTGDVYVSNNADNTNLTISQDITVWAAGTLYFTNNSDGLNEGGLRGNKKIINHGTVRRMAAGPLRVEADYDAEGNGVFQVDNGYSITIGQTGATNGFKQDGGGQKTKLHDGSTLNVIGNMTISAGDLWCLHNSSAGTTVTIDPTGSFTWSSSGALRVGYDATNPTAGYYQTLQINSDFTMTGGTVYYKINGTSGPPHNDTISATGTISINPNMGNNCTANVTTIGTPPMNTMKYQLLHSSKGTAGVADITGTFSNPTPGTGWTWDYNVNGGDTLKLNKN